MRTGRLPAQVLSCRLIVSRRLHVTDLPEPTSLSIERLAAELDELARHAPSRLAQRVAEMTVQQQAELALRLEPRQRMELLLHAPKPMRLVRALPDFDWYVTVREIGPADSLALIRLAAREQILHLFDLEAWRHDRFDGDRAGAWLAVLLESGEPALRRFLQHVLPKGFHKIRYYGLWHPSRRDHAARIQLMLRLDPLSVSSQKPIPTNAGKDITVDAAKITASDHLRICPSCRLGHLVHAGRLYPKQVRGP